MYIFTVEIAYCLFLSTFSNTLKTLLVDILKELFAVGLCPKLTVCEQGTNNQNVLKSLNVSADQPYFYVNEKNICYIR